MGGILYKNGANTGFFPIVGVTVTGGIPIGDTVDLNDYVTFAEIQTAIIEAVAAYSTVRVINTNASPFDAGMINSLVLNIPAAKTVKWEAAYTGTTAGNLIRLLGGGTFEVAAGGSITNNGIGYAIRSYAANGAITVSGGTVSSTSDNAIYVDTDTSATITVSGGAVSSTSGNAIYVNTYTSADVTVSGGTVSATTGTSIYLSDDNSSLAVSGGGCICLRRGHIRIIQRYLHVQRFTNDWRHRRGRGVESGRG